MVARVAPTSEKRGMKLMKMGRTTKKIAVGAACAVLATGLIACAGCSSSSSSTLYEAGTHTYHQLDTNWELAYGWYQADTPEGFHVNNQGTIFSTDSKVTDAESSAVDTMYKFDNPGSTNSSSYQSIQVRLEKGYVDSTEVKTKASDTAWQNDPSYENELKRIEMKTAYRKTGEKEINGRTWVVMEADPAVDASVDASRAASGKGKKKSCKYLTKLDDKAYVVVDGYQIAADDDIMTNFLNSFQTVDSNYYDTFQAWNEENSISKKSPAGMW